MSNTIPTQPAYQFKGKLLYQEEWANKRGFKDRSNLIMGPMLIGMGFVLIGISISLLFPIDMESSILPTFMFFGISAVLVFMGFSLFKQSVVRMPFRLYEGGFTLPTVSFGDGLKRKEDFVSWYRLRKASIENYSMFNMAFKMIRLDYDDHKELDLTSELTEDPFLVMKILRDRIPGKMDDSFNIYLGKEEERKIIKKPLPEKTDNFSTVMILGLIVFIGAMVGSFFFSSLSQGKFTSAIFLLGIFLPIFAIFFRMAFSLDEERVFKSNVKASAKAAESGITIPKTLLGRLTKKQRPYVPYREVKAVRLKLDPMFYSHEAEFETLLGERCRVQYHVYEEVSKNPNFYLSDFNYLNKSPGSPDAPLRTNNPIGIAALLLLLASPGLMLGLSSGTMLLDAVENFQTVCIAVVFVVLLPILLYSYWKMAQRNRLSHGMFVSDRGIHLESAPEKFRFIARNEVIGARIDKDIFGYYCQVDTTKGTLKFPQSAAEKLLQGGYKVEGADYFSQFSEPGMPDQRGYTAGGEMEEIEVPDTMAPGALLLEEAPESVQQRRKKLLKYGVILTVSGIFILPLGVFLFLYDSVLCGLTILVISLIISLLFLFLGVLLVRGSRRSQPIRIYDNGISFPNEMKKKGFVFVPYGRMRTYSEGRNPLQGEVVNFHLDTNTMLNIPKSMPGFPEVFESIRDRVGDPSYDVKEFSLLSKSAAKKLEYLIYGSALAMGYFFAYFSFSSPSKGIGQILTIGSALSLLLLTFMVYWYAFARKNEQIAKSIRYKNLLVLLVALLVLFAAGNVIYEPELHRVTILKDSPPASYINNTTVIEGVFLNVTDNIYVSSGDSLVLRNSTLFFTMGANKGRTIFVEEGGELLIYNSTLTSQSPELGYAFEIHGRAIIEHANISHVYGNESVNNGDGGIEIYSDDVRISNSIIHNNSVNGILISGASPTIEQSVIENCSDDGIEIQDSDCTIRSCTIRNTGWAIIMNPGSEVHFEDNVVEANGHGISVYGSNPVIRNNKFYNNENYAIEVYDNADPVIESNVYSGNDEDVTSDTTLDSMCRTVYLVLMLVGTVSLLFIIRKLKNQEQKR